MFSRIFSPSKCNADEVFKNEFFNEIKTNLNLTSAACKKLQKLLFSDHESYNEISDFPSPSIPSNFRKSAPARLFSKKKSKRPSIHNDFLRIVNCFTSDKDNNNLQNKISKNVENLQLKNTNDENKQNKIASSGNVILKMSDDRDALKKKSNYVEGETLTNKSKIPIISNDQERRPCQVQEEQFDKHGEKGNKTKIQGSKSRKKDETNETENDKRYSSVYNLQQSCSNESSSLFYTLKPKKNVKPTIVCTYFSQV